MSKLLYQMINPPIRLLLKSPLHGLMSSNTLIIEFKGRKSGRTMTTPISYLQTDTLVQCFTGRPNIWWRNLQNAAPVRLLIKGQWQTVIPEVVLDDHETIKQTLDNFLRAVPRDASHSNVRLEADGTPNQQDIDQAVGNLVLLKFSPVSR
tara:strand:- start:466 stop:915 length:450 start_codon:yes stop_codon:yes gene_type:complete